MKKLFLALLLVGANLIAGTAIDANGAYKLNRHNKLFSDLGVGSQLGAGGWLKGRYQYSVQGGAGGTSITLLDNDGRPAKLPDNAIIDDCIIEVIERPASATSSGRIGFSSNAVEDLKALAVAHTTYLADTRVACLPTGNITTAIKMGSEATLKMIVGSESLTAGKLNVWVSYVIGD